ncbi:MAG: tryptophan synthase subunit alpha, partial [Aigarchaeota archaeon]|nr:tryptophan synthase subunit alpha [Aigarchaeota archaeon]
VLEIACHITSRYDVSMVILTYLNPVYRMGVEKFMEKAQSMGVSGLIIPDLPLEEARAIKPISEKYGISLVLLAAPTTSDERLAQILEESMSFTYLISLKGTTGERDEVPPTAQQLLLRAKKIKPDKPVAIGFGISSPSQTKKLSKLGADGIIVGSRLISEIKKNEDRPEEAV